MKLYEHINQNGVTFGPKKYEIFLKACALQEVPPLQSTEDQSDPVALVKIFDPCGSWTWYITEVDPETGEAFGLVKGFETEIGYIDLQELAATRGALNIGLEVDVWFDPTPISELME